MTQSPPKVIVYLYVFSPYGRKISQYLTLRGIPYSVVEQPAMMPRPDLDLIGVKYRRIPIVSLGRDIYCDTFLILRKLEAAFTGNTLSATNSKDLALQTLLEKWMSDRCFQRGTGTLPADHPAMSNSAFLQDRTELWGGEWGAEKQKRVRPTALKEMQEEFEFLESLLSEGNDWILGGKGPTLADLHAVWYYDWLLEMCPGSLPASHFSPTTFPKTFALRGRYRAAVAAARAAHPPPDDLSGAEAARRISSSPFHEPDGTLRVDENDHLASALGLKAGMRVDVWPADTTVKEAHYENGTLEVLDAMEVVVRTKMADGGEVRVHTPRWNYTLRKAE